MPTYRVRDSVSGVTLDLTGDSPPTDQELTDLFAQYGKKEPERTVLGQIGETFKAVPRGIANTVLSTGEGLAELADAATNLVGAKGLVDSGDENALVKASREGRDWIANSALGADPTYQDAWFTKFGEGVGSMATFLAPVGILRGLGVAGKAIPRLGTSARELAATGALATGSGAGEQAQRVAAARAQGLEVTQGQEDLAVGLGGLVGLSEVAPIAFLLKRVPSNITPANKSRILDLLRRSMVGGFQEATQEVVAGVAQDLIEQKIYNENIPIGQSLWDDLTVGGAVGAFADFVVNAAAGRRSFITTEAQREYEAKAREREQANIEKIRQSLATAAERRANIQADPEGFNKAAAQAQAAAAGIAPPTGEGPPVERGGAYARAISNQLGDYFPTNTKFTVEALPLETEPDFTTRTPEGQQVTFAKAKQKFVVKDSQGNQYGQVLDSQEEASALAYGLNTEAIDQQVRGQVLNTLETSGQAYDRVTADTLTRYGVQILSPDRNLITSAAINEAAGTTADKGYIENYSFQTILDGEKTKDGYVVQGPSQQRVTVPGLTLSQQINQKRKEQGLPETQTFTVDEAREALGDKFENLTNINVAAIPDNLSYTATVMDGKPVVVSAANEVFSSRFANEADSEASGKNEDGTPKIKVGQKIELKSLEDAQAFAERKNKEAAKGQGLSTQEINEILKGKKTLNDEITRLLKSKNIGSEIDTPEIKTLFKSIVGKESLADMSFGEQRLLYARLRTLPTFEATTKLPVFEAKPYTRDNFLAASKFVQDANSLGQSFTDDQIAQAAGILPNDERKDVKVEAIKAELVKQGVPVTKPEKPVLLLPGPDGTTDTYNFLREEIRKKMKGFGLDDIATRIDQTLLNFGDPVRYMQEMGAETEGYYNPLLREITLAVDRIDPQKTLTPEQRVNALVDVLNHEIVHPVRRMDLWTGKEWDTLSNAAARLKRKDDQGKDTGQTYLEFARQTYADKSPLVHEEEAVADLSRQAKKFGAKAVAGKPKVLADRLFNFFDRLDNSFRGAGFQSYSDILDRLQSGEVGARTRGEIRTLRATEAEMVQRGVLPERFGDYQPILATPVVRNQEREKKKVEVQQKAQAAGITDFNPASLEGAAIRESRRAIENIPKTIDVDGVVKPTDDSEGRAIYSGYEGPEVYGIETAPTQTGLRNFWNWFSNSKAVDSQGRPVVYYHGTAADITEFRPKQAGSVFITRNPEFSELFAGYSNNYMIVNFPDFMNDQEVSNVLTESMRSATTPKFYDKLEKIQKRVANRVGQGKALDAKSIADIKELYSDKTGGLSSKMVDSIRRRLPSAPNLMPVYVKAENPWDYENKDHVRALLKEVKKQYGAELDVSQLDIENIRDGDWVTIEGSPGNSPFLDAIRNLGFDSMYVKEAGTKNLAVFNPEQIKSAVGNNGQFGPTPSIMESRVSTVSSLQYPLAPEGTWYGEGTFREDGGRLIYLTPDQYIAAVRPLRMDDESRENIDLLKEHIQSGKTLDPLLIRASGKEDGRHRAYAAKELGIKEVPVIVYGDQFKDVPSATTPSILESRKYSAVGKKLVEPVVSTRVPTAIPRGKKATAVENPIDIRLQIGAETFNQDPKLISNAAALISNYPNIRTKDRNLPPDQLVEKFVQDITGNLLWLYDNVPAEIRSRSKLWYVGANRISNYLSDLYEISPNQAAAVLAVNSPQTEWFTNVTRGERLTDIWFNKKNFDWSPEMEETASKIFAKQKYKKDLDAIRGKTLAAIPGDPVEKLIRQAMWIRTYDQSHNRRNFRIITPEGSFGDFVVTDKGNQAIATWAGLDHIVKSISILEDGSLNNISNRLGNAHKVRSFYNNIIAPDDPAGDVTIDTHAVAAALLRPLSGKSIEVSHNLGAGMSNALRGVRGLYGIYAEAYRRAAAQRNVLPREMQSITWEAIRGTFTDVFKRSKPKINAIENSWRRYRDGQLDNNEIRDIVLQEAGGINEPDWWRSNRNAPKETWSSTYGGELSGFRVSGRGASSRTGRVDTRSARRDRQREAPKTKGIMESRIAPRPEVQLQDATKKAQANIDRTPTGAIPLYNLNASPDALYVAQNPEAGEQFDAQDLIRYSRTNQPQYTTGVQQIIDKLAVDPPNQTPGQTVIGAVQLPPIRNMIDKLRQQFIFNYSRLEYYNQTHPSLINNLADVSSLAGAEMADRHKAITASAITDGVPVYRDGLVRVEPFVHNNREYKGLIDVMAPLYSNPYGNLERLAQAYAIAIRGRRLTAEGKLAPGDPADLPQLLSEVRRFTNPATGNSIIEEWYDAWQAYNAYTVQFLRDTGMIDDAGAQLWLQQSDYIPFYRETAAGTVAHPKIFGGLTSTTHMKAVGKSSEAINLPLLDSVLTNLDAAIGMGMRNVAQQRIVRDMIQIGMGRMVQPGQLVEGQPTVTFKVAGKKYTAFIDDPLIFESMQALPEMGAAGILENVFRVPATVLRELIVREPGYMLANMMRDTASVALTSGANIIPAVDTVRNFANGLDNLRRFGVVGGYDFSRDPENITEYLADEAKKRGHQIPVDYDSKLKGFSKSKYMRPLTWVWDLLGGVSDKAEASTRNAVYQDTLKRTGNEAEAVYQALSVINYGRRGRNPSIRAITASVPFLNARIQGLDKLYQAGTGQAGAFKDRRKNFARFVFRAGLMVGLTGLYYALVSDDEEYKNANPEVVDNYYIIPIFNADPAKGEKGLAFRVPIPFEVGLLFKTIPERIMRRYYDVDVARDTEQSLKRAVTSTLAFNPVPQAVLPIAEVIANYDTFTGRTIIPPYMNESMAAEYQARFGTNEFARILGEATGISPIKIDHLMNGYLGTIGTYTLDAIDHVLRDADRMYPSREPYQYPFVRRFFADSNQPGLQTQYYDLYKEVGKVTNTIRQLREDGRVDELQAYLMENQTILGIKSGVDVLNKRMKQYRDQKEAILKSTLDPDVKKELIDDLDASINQTLQVVPILKRAAYSEQRQAG
jgi:hypothetical protein